MTAQSRIPGRFTLPTDDPGRHMVARAHVQRLRERARAIETALARAETQSTLHHWKRRTDPKLTAAINRRTNHLTHIALTTGDPAVAELAIAIGDAHPTATANELRQAIRSAVAERERSRTPQQRPDQTEQAPVGLGGQTMAHAELSM